tara:strand:- start:846 stop:1286 length:441 start_codon:yes stop_codon:yes gene_type:complete
MKILDRLKQISQGTDWNPTFVKSEDWDLYDDTIELLGESLCVQISDNVYTIVEALDNGDTKFSFGLLSHDEVVNYLQAYHKSTIDFQLTPDGELHVYVKCGDKEYEGIYVEGNILKRMPDTIEWQECPSFWEYLEDRIKDLKYLYH